MLHDDGLKINQLKWGKAAPIKSRGAGLYIIALDNHVGFILKDRTCVWFILAKWYDRGLPECAVLFKLPDGGKD